MSDTPIKLSVLLPAYNEEGRVCGTLSVLQEYFARQDYGVEAVVVSDGSTDRTKEVAEEQHPWARVVAYTENRGKGYATKVGLRECRGEFILISDADGSTPISDVEKMWPKLEAGCDIVIGSRAMKESDIEVRQPLYRQTMGRIYNVILRLLGLTSFKDTQCGFKIIRKSIVEAVTSRMTSDGFGADCEMLFIAAKLGYKVDEVPVRWLNSLDSKVHPIWDSAEMLWEAILVRVKSLMGVYR